MINDYTEKKIFTLKMDLEKEKLNKLEDISPFHLFLTAIIFVFFLSILDNVINQASFVVQWIFMIIFLVLLSISSVKFAMRYHRGTNDIDELR